MVRLIDCTYFTKGLRLVQNAPLKAGTTANQNEMAVEESLNGWIDSVQEQFLNDIIGLKMTKILLAYLIEKELAPQQEPSNEGEAEAGDAETDEELDFLASSLKESLADYVMYKMLRGTRMMAQNTGAVVLKSGNERDNTARLQSDLWNSMVRRNKLFLEEAKSRLTNYTICYVSDMVTPINPLNL